MGQVLGSLDAKCGKNWTFGNYAKGAAPYDTAITSALRRLIPPIFVSKSRMDEVKDLMEKYPGKNRSRKYKPTQNI